MRRLHLFILLISCYANSLAATEPSIINLYTNYGVIGIQLESEKAPITTNNFLSYVNEGFYSNTLFHRTIPNFMIQGGGFDTKSQAKATHAPIKLETSKDLSNLRGTVAMARTAFTDSATSQFFINTKDNNFPAPGYAVFAKVVDGMDVVDNISQVKTRLNAAKENSQPVEAVIIQSAKLRESQLNFPAFKALYRVGETLSISLQEETLTRQKTFDLWVAIRFPNGDFYFVSPENPSLLNKQANPFQRKVSLNSKTHPVFDITIPKGISGQYTLYALFNPEGLGLENLSQSLSSNLASATVNIQ